MLINVGLKASEIQGLALKQLGLTISEEQARTIEQQAAENLAQGLIQTANEIMASEILFFAANNGLKSENPSVTAGIALMSRIMAEKKAREEKLPEPKGSA